MNKNKQNWDELDKPKSNCGVVGIYGSEEAAKLVYLSLYSLQHRGQESAGISSYDGEKFHRHAGMGLVADVFNDDKVFDKLPGSMAIGHNRYSTTGTTRIINAQPLLAKSKMGMISISHNGNLVNARRIRHKLENEGAIFQTTSDTEVIMHLLARSRADNMIDGLREVFTILKGAYSLTIMTADAIYGVRDPKGFRPLCIGKKDGILIFASETCAIDLLGGEYVREVEAGEIVVFDKTGMSSHILGAPQERTACIFEHVYFSRPDSKVFDENVDRARRKLGKNLALEKPCDADIVISVPDSSNTAAVGYSRRSGIKFELGLIRNHYIGRTFIQPGQKLRDFNVRVKFNVVKGVINGRRVIVVEDSIVRGTTLRQLTRMLKNAGAREVHIRVTSPPITSPCYYGMDFPTREELIANGMSIEKICEYLEADSLEYLSTEGLLNSVPHDKGGYCTACFTGKYPIPPEKIKNKNDLED
ncbi:MAG: amidophosphoribosyltransferase [Deferribacteres bacterium]|nr:amidophosphoribosyltransferase [candidate division KSB1 bacterium]MCB9503327.1 amidophosphoribosyltransferase [Deferribacteres bacterium]